MMAAYYDPEAARLVEEHRARVSADFIRDLAEAGKPLRLKLKLWINGTQVNSSFAFDGARICHWAEGGPLFELTTETE